MEKKCIISYKYVILLHFIHYCVGFYDKIKSGLYSKQRVWKGISKENATLKLLKNLYLYFIQIENHLLTDS